MWLFYLTVWLYILQCGFVSRSKTLSPVWPYILQCDLLLLFLTLYCEVWLYFAVWFIYSWRISSWHYILSVTLYISVWHYISQCDFISLSLTLYLSVWLYISQFDIISLSVTLYLAVWLYISHVQINNAIMCDSFIVNSFWSLRKTQTYVSYLWTRCKDTH